MEINPDLTENITTDPDEFKKLFEEHSTLKQKVEELNKMKFLTAEQEVEKKQHQKQKLKMKDRLEEILHQYQSQLH